jgi:hypothetical protein
VKCETRSSRLSLLESSSAHRQLCPLTALAFTRASVVKPYTRPSRPPHRTLVPGGARRLLMVMRVNVKTSEGARCKFVHIATLHKTRD